MPCPAAATIPRPLPQPQPPPYRPKKMRIYATDTKEGSSQQPLPNEATLADHEIANDAVLYVVFRKEGKEDVEDATADADDDCWEAIDIETGEME